MKAKDSPSYMLLNTIRSYEQKNPRMVNVVLDRYKALTVIEQLAIGLRRQEQDKFTLMFSGQAREISDGEDSEEDPLVILTRLKLALEDKDHTADCCQCGNLNPQPLLELFKGKP